MGRGGGLVERAGNSGPYDPSSIPLGEKKENKGKKKQWLAHIIKAYYLLSYFHSTNNISSTWHLVA